MIGFLTVAVKLRRNNYNTPVDFILLSETNISYMWPAHFPGCGKRANKEDEETQ